MCNSTNLIHAKQFNQTRRLTKELLQQGLDNAIARAEKAEAAITQFANTAEIARGRERIAVATAEEANREALDAKAKLATLIADHELETAAAPPALGSVAMQPEVDGVMHIWLTIRGQGYKLAFGGQDQHGKRITFTKFTDGMIYTLRETDNGRVACDCPAGQKGMACKHRKMLKAAQALLATNGTTYKPEGAAQVARPTTTKAPANCKIVQVAGDALRPSASADDEQFDEMMLPENTLERLRVLRERQVSKRKAS